MRSAGDKEADLKEELRRLNDRLTVQEDMLARLTNHFENITHGLEKRQGQSVSS